MQAKRANLLFLYLFGTRSYLALSLSLASTVDTALLWCAHYKLPCQDITLTGTCEGFWCVCLCYIWGMRSCECVVYVGRVHAVCVFWCLPAVHSVVKKVAQYMADVLEDSRDKVQENLLANGGTVVFVAQCGSFTPKIKLWLSGWCKGWSTGSKFE